MGHACGGQSFNGVNLDRWGDEGSQVGEMNMGDFLQQSWSLVVTCIMGRLLKNSSFTPH